MIDMNIHDITGATALNFVSGGRALVSVRVNVTGGQHATLFFADNGKAQAVADAINAAVAAPRPLEMAVYDESSASAAACVMRAPR